MTASRTVLVCGSTGRQGGQVTRRLLRDGDWIVRALTRSPEGPAAKKLARLGANLVRGDLSDPVSLREALEGCDAVFGVTDFWEHGLRAEVEQGRGLVDQAREAGVTCFVFSSVGATDRTQGAGIAHFDSKRRIEEHLQRSGLAWTILRPVTFFENFTSDRYLRSIRKGVFSFCFEPGRSFQMVALADLAEFAVRALREPAAFSQRALEIASDRFTMEDFCAALGRAVNRPVRYRLLGPSVQRAIAHSVAAIRASHHFKVGPSLVAQFRWNNGDPRGGWDADLEALRRIHPGLMTMERWVQSVDWVGAGALREGAT